MIIVECFYFIKFSLNKASKKNWMQSLKLWNQHFKTKAFTLRKPLKNEDYDDSNDNDFVARLLVDNDPLDTVTHLLNQK